MNQQEDYFTRSRMRQRMAAQQAVDPITHEPIVHKWGFRFAWYPFFNSKPIISSTGHDSYREAKRAVYDIVIKEGYYPPKWYQYWRWKEVRFDDIL